MKSISFLSACLLLTAILTSFCNTVLAQNSFPAQGAVKFDAKLQHQGDGDTHIKFVDDRQLFTVGGETYLEMKKRNNGSLISLGNGSDIQLDFNQSMKIIRSSVGEVEVGIGVPDPDGHLHLYGDSMLTTFRMGRERPDDEDEDITPGAQKEIYVGTNGTSPICICENLNAEYDEVEEAPRKESKYYDAWKACMEIRHEDDPATLESLYEICRAPEGDSAEFESYFRIQSDKLTGLFEKNPQQELHVDGQILAQNYITASDARFKTDIKSLESVVDKMMNLRGVTYYLDAETFPGKNVNADEKQIGFLAQELEEVFPELVITHENGLKGVKYQGMIPVLVEVAKEQQTELNAKQATIDQLSSKVASLEEQIQTLEQLQQTVEELQSAVQGCCANPSRGTTISGDKASLGQNIPNPFSRATTIPFYLPESVSNAVLQITDAAGKLISRLDLTQRGLGQKEIQLPTNQKGIFFYSLLIEGKVVATKQMLLTE